MAQTWVFSWISDISNGNGMARLNAFLFPGSPATNALLATAYISGPPNFLLYLIPVDLDMHKLNYLIAFAAGGLLGDVFLHLLPQTFLGEAEEGGTYVARAGLCVNDTMLLGGALMVGFVVFFVMDKCMRIAIGSSGHSHGHDHDSKPTVKPSAYLNLVADFCHNITDGLAIAASFYVSTAIGATTTAAVFFHEIPAEMGDCAILIRAGYSKFRAAGMQFVTALGALSGTLLGIGINTVARDAAVHVSETQPALFSEYLGASIAPQDLVLPFTAGSFIYIACLGVVPELLEVDENSKSTRRVDFVRAGLQVVAMMSGVVLIGSLN